LLDRTSESYARDVLTLVESILENPKVVLFAQLDRLKTEKLAAMKAEGIEYEQRIEELEQLEWPKPLRDFIYDTFNAFAAKHPWVGEENIRPKSIARDLVERFCSFNDYVRDYRLQRAEGVLLRYVSQAYKVLVQTVPERFKSDELDDIIDELRTMLRTVDSSLLEEWQSLREPPAGAEPAPVSPPVRSLRDDPRALASRVRSELHRLLYALAQKRYPDALALLRPSATDDDWTAERLQAEMAAYWEEHATIDTTPRARRPDQTLIKPGNQPRTLSAIQKILDPAGDEDWRIECVIDLSAPFDDSPLLQLRSIRR
jgi:hypothetical protein